MFLKRGSTSGGYHQTLLRGYRFYGYGLACAEAGLAFEFENAGYVHSGLQGYYLVGINKPAAASIGKGAAQRAFAAGGHAAEDDVAFGVEEVTVFAFDYLVGESLSGE